MKTAPTCRVLSALFLLLSAGCRGAKDRIICAIPESVSQEIFFTARAGMDEAAAPFGLTVEWNGPGASDPQLQIDLITQATRERRFGIVVTPVGGAAIDTALEGALSRGIPVVITRDLTSLREQPHLSFVLEDYQAGARLVLQQLQKLAGCKGTVVILGVDKYSENSVRRLDALEAELRSECPQLHVAQPVVAPFGSGYVQVAAERALAKYPDLVSFVALNARAGLGAEAAMEDRALMHHVAVIAFDPSLPLLVRLRRGWVDAIVSQDMRGMGERAVENIVADRAGKSYRRTVTLAPMVITRSNIDAAATQDWLQFNADQPS
ncbi:MAG: sugar ABC transporter substrate-binding protein [Acidobacteriota bacterium]